MNACNCYGLGWVTPCCDNRECICEDSCCNTGRLVDDGDGYEDFMPEEKVCRCIGRFINGKDNE